MRGTAGRRPPSRSSWISRTRRPPPPPAPHGQGRNHQGCSSIPLPGNSMNKTVTHAGPHQRASAPTPLLATCLSLWRHGWELLPPARLPARPAGSGRRQGAVMDSRSFPRPGPRQAGGALGRLPSLEAHLLRKRPRASVRLVAGLPGPSSSAAAGPLTQGAPAPCASPHYPSVFLTPRHLWPPRFWGRPCSRG